VTTSGSGGAAGSAGSDSGAGSGEQIGASSGTCFAGNAGPELMLGEWISNDPALTDPYDPRSLLELYLPPGVNVIRGLVFMHGRGTPERPSHTRGMAEVAQVWSFGMIRGYIWEIAGERLSHQAQADLLAETIAEWAARTGHPELVNVPVLAIGESRTAGLPAELESFWPGRVVGQSQVVGGIDAAKADSALLSVPSMVLPSEFDEMQGKLERHFLAARARGGLWAGSVQWKKEHGFYNAWDIDWPFFNELVRLRVPRDQTAEAGAVALAPVEEASGWLGDATQWSGWNTIAPYGEYPGDKARAAWLPSKAAALAWRAYSVPDPKLQITAPTTPYDTWSKSPDAFGRRAAQGFNRQSTIEFVAEALTQPAPESVEFLVGERSLGVVTGASPYRVTASQFEPGVYAAVAIATFPDGKQESSRPAVIAILPDELCR
jgi:hypothetical protein